MASPAAVLQILVTANTAQATTALTKTQTQLKATEAVATSTAATMRSRLATGAKYGALALAGLGAASVKMSVDFDKSMRNVNSIAQLNEKQLQKLEDQVKSLAGKTAQSPQTLAEGLYDLVSSGFDAKESMVVLAASAKAATAGLTDTATSTKAVAAVLNAYRLPAKKAADVSDTLFQTVNLGVVSFEELSSTIGDVLPFASSLNVKLNEVGAAVSTMTKAGISPAETMTRLKAAMSALIKPSEGMTAALKQLGYESGEALIKQEGFQGALETLAKAAGGSKEELAKMFPNIRALGAALALTGKNTRGAEKDLAAFADTSGATNKALSQQSKSVSYQWNKLKAQASALAIDIGDNLIPTLKNFLDILTNPKLTLSEKVQRLGSELTKTIEEWAPKAAAAGAVIGAAIIKGMWNAFWDSDLLGKLFLAGTFIRILGGPGVFGKLGAAIGTRLGGAIAARLGPGIMAALGPAGIFAGVAGAGIYGLMIPNDFDDRVRQTVDKVVAQFEKMRNKVTPHLFRIGAAAVQMGAGVRITKNDFNTAANGAENFADALKDTAREMRDFAQVVDKQMDKVGDATKDTGKVIKDFASGSSDSFGKTSDKSRSMADKVGDNIGNLARVVTQGLGVIVTNTNKALQGFGVKKVAISLEKVGGAAKGFQTGGVIVPGQGDGDKVPAMLEPGEVVWNKKAVAAMGGASRANKVNSMIPRFAKGGVAKGGAMAAMVGLVNKYERASYPYQWGGGHSGFVNANSPVDCSGFVSDVLHAGGLLQGAPMVSGALMGWGKPATGNEPLVVYANPGHTVMSLNGRVAGTSGSNPGGGAGWIEGGNGAALAPGAKRTMDVAGAVAAHIARVLLKGPNGPLKSMGQAALDKARSAANKFIASKMPMGMGGGGDLGPLGKAIVKGRATWFTGGTMASGANTDTDPGIALNPNPGGPDPGSWNNPTTQRWLHDAQQFLVKLGGKQAVLPVLDMGPAGWTGNAIDVDRAGVGRLGFSTSSFPSGTVGTAQAIHKQLGGVVGFAKGGKAKKDKTLHGAAHSMGLDPDSRRLRRVRRIMQRISDLVGEKGRAARLDETIGRVETLAALDSSPFGSDLSPGELARQIALNERLLETLTRARKLSRSGLHLANLKAYSESGDRQFKGPRGALTQTLLDLQGLTGRGGRIFDTKVHLAELKGTTAAGATAMDISTLRSVIEAARYGVFDSQLPRFHSGGTYRAPVGRNEGAAVLRDGERVISGETFVGYANIDLGEGITQRVKLEFTKRDRQAHLAGRQYRP